MIYPEYFVNLCKIGKQINRIPTVSNLIVLCKKRENILRKFHWVNLVVRVYIKEK